MISRAGLHSAAAGLDFLRETAEFQDRYADTVISRIFFVYARGPSLPPDIAAGSCPSGRQWGLLH